jgi:hypothetical protein
MHHQLQDEVLTVETREDPLGQDGHQRDSKVSKLKLLAVSFAYPPMLEPRAIQVSRLLQHLDASSTLICADYEDKDILQDLTFAGGGTHLDKLVRVPFPWRSKARKLVGRLLNKLKVPLWDKSPDNLRPWKKPVVKAIEKMVSHDRYAPDVLLTFSYPLTDALIGLELNRKLGVPWVAHFSDPWTDNPTSRLDPLSKAVHRRMEREVVETADRLVFTSEETIDLIMGKYPARLRAKTRVLPHAFEPEIYSSLKEGSTQKITVRYLGTLYGPRTPKPFFSALERLLIANPEVLTDVCFEIIGDTSGMNLDAMGLRNLPNGLVHIAPPVGYMRSIELMVSADGLLVVDAPAEKSVFLPSKLIDYVGSGRPILGITPPGAAASLIDRMGGWVADPGNIEAGIEALTAFLGYIRSQRNTTRSPWGNPLVRRSYEASEVAELFNQILRELI